jgi:hypothetical protein
MGTSESNKPQPAKIKRPYRKPKLTHYGSAAKLTRGGASSPTSDSGGNMMSPMP